MRLHKPLDKILNNEIKVRILRFLCKTQAEWSGRQIAEEIKGSPAACHKVLHELKVEGVLLHRSIGKSYQYCLNENNFIVSTLLKPLYEKENKIFLEVNKIIIKTILSSVRKDIISLIIFGSVSRKKETAESDIDLLILVKTVAAKEKVSKTMGTVNTKILKKFGNPISPYIQTLKEFQSKFKKGLPLIKNILNFHNVIFGKSLEDICNVSKTI